MECICVPNRACVKCSIYSFFSVYGRFELKQVATAIENTHTRCFSYLFAVKRLKNNEERVNRAYSALIAPFTSFLHLRLYRITAHHHQYTITSTLRVRTCLVMIPLAWFVLVCTRRPYIHVYIQRNRGKMAVLSTCWAQQLYCIGTQTVSCSVIMYTPFTTLLDDSTSWHKLVHAVWYRYNVNSQKSLKLLLHQTPPTST